MDFFSTLEFEYIKISFLKWNLDAFCRLNSYLENNSLVAQMVKNPPAMWKTWVGKIPWRRAWQPTPVFLPGESPWTEDPGGYSPAAAKSL